MTGRSIRGFSTRSELPGTTIDDTAEQVTERGGVGIAIRCDHAVDTDVDALFERIHQGQGRLDLLVNNVWGGYEKDPDGDFVSSFWEQPLWRWDAMFQSGVRAYYTATPLAARLMIKQGQGQIINTTFWDRDKYMQPLSYDLSKQAINRMTYGFYEQMKILGLVVKFY